MALTEARFRDLALRLEGAVESAHQGHPEFRVGGRTFATLRYPREGWGVVVLTPDQQARLTEEDPYAFVPVKGA